MSGRDKKKKKRSARSRSRSPRRRDASRSPRRRKRASSRSRESSESSSLSEDDGRREKRYRDNGRKKTKDKKKEKEYYKAHETAEEKRARRLAKKEAKERKRRKEMGWNDEYEGYTNTDNPYGDAHLLETFVWHKKREKHGEADLSEEEKRFTDKKRQMDTRKQLESLRQRKIEREREMMLREEEKERMQRDKESTYYSEWEKQEDKFHLNQAKLRSKIRIQDGRAKPIDLLAQYISNEDEDLDIKMHEPYTILVGLTKEDLSDLIEDIKVYVELEQGKNTEYWQDVTLICKDELQKLRKQLRDDVDRREGIHTSVHSDVASVFKGKTYSQLIALEKQILAKISRRDNAVDIGYWESLQQQLKFYMAKARLRERHQKMLKDKLMQLRQEKSVMSGSSDEIELSESEPESEKEETAKKMTLNREEKEQEEQDKPSTSTSWRDEPEEEQEATEDVTTDEPSGSLFTEEDLIEESYAAFEAGNYSPKLIKITDVDENLVVDPDDDWQKLLELREEVMAGGTSLLMKTLGSSAMEEEEAKKGMGPDEETFNVPVPLSQKTYVWEDKYRPRKPRFFNRVHTGYEWNKYNQTHYDSENPPPKIVQGYKFNIFYPDLIEKAVAPEYYLDPCSDSKDFAILRFHAGPPYEDIAFKIVNREWEYSHRKGFRCQFHNNVFQLWFHFKRYRYRR